LLLSVVTVCTTAPLFVQVIFVPTVTVITLGTYDQVVGGLKGGSTIATCAEAPRLAPEAVPEDVIVGAVGVPFRRAMVAGDATDAVGVAIVVARAVTVSVEVGVAPVLVAPPEHAASNIELQSKSVARMIRPARPAE
jgi:hypothetical protein